VSLPLLPAMLLLAALAAVAWFVRGDLGEYRRFKALSDSRSRRRRYGLWVAKAWAAFGVPAVLGLLLLGRGEALVVMPPEFAPLAAALPRLEGGDGDFAGGAIGGAAIGGLLVGLFLATRRRKGRAVADPFTLGDVGALLPRNRGELGYGVALSVTAGVVEEAFFRLFLPLLLVLVTGSAVVAFVAAGAIFGAMHLYQGWAGVLGTTVMAAVLSFLFLASGLLWVAMLVHVAIDLNGLVVRPVLGGAWGR
jgi:uncharacterized protein